MPDFGITVEPDGTIKAGDLDNPYVITPAQIASFAAGKTAAQLEASVNGLLNPRGFMVLVQSVDPLRFTLHNTTRVPSAEIRARLGI